jgi:hypothetical protein
VLIRHPREYPNKSIFDDFSGTKAGRCRCGTPAAPLTT